MVWNQLHNCPITNDDVAAADLTHHGPALSPSKGEDPLQHVDIPAPVINSKLKQQMDFYYINSNIFVIKISDNIMYRTIALHIFLIAQNLQFC